MSAIGAKQPLPFLTRKQRLVSIYFFLRTIIESMMRAQVLNVHFCGTSLANGVYKCINPGPAKEGGARPKMQFATS
jgi:hypothetical protein